MLRKHPWVFSGSISDVEGEPGLGETVEILDHKGEWLARGAFSPHSQIRIRVWTWDQAEMVDGDFISRRIKNAVDKRIGLYTDPATTAFREIHGESDGIPGLIVDRYNEILVVQILAAGVEYHRATILESLQAIDGCQGVYERSDVGVRELEGLPRRDGSLWGQKPGEGLTIRENDLQYFVDIERGQKTGFYLDQRENRSAIRTLVSSGEVLDCFCYTGAFAVHALSAGAKKVTGIDSSGKALKLANSNLGLNDLIEDRCEWIEGDAFQKLRELRESKRKFNLIILDPPRLAPTASTLPRASRAYKDLNLLAFQLLHPGGFLVTFSCSGGVTSDLFQKIVAGSALDAGVAASIVGWLGQGSDHPVGLTFPEGRYLKGLICRID